jgi:hypothetical protein
VGEGEGSALLLLRVVGQFEFHNEIEPAPKELHAVRTTAEEGGFSRP